MAATSETVTADQLQLLVSGQVLRTAALPWSDALTTPEGRIGFAAGRWRQVFGETTADWSLTVEPGPFEQASILLAAPRALVQHWQSQSAPTLLIQPLVTVAHARYAATLPADCLFAVLEPGCLMLALVQGGRIRRLSRHRVDAVGGDWRKDVTSIHRRLLLQEPELADLGPLRLLALLEPARGARDDTAFTLLPWPASSVEQSLMMLAAGMRAATGFNLVPPRSRRSRWQQAALAVAAAIFLCALGSWFHVGHGEAVAESVPVVVAPPPPLSGKDRQQLQREVTAVNKAVAELNLPADAVIATVSPGQLTDVALLGVELGNTGEGKVRVTAGAKSIAGMESYLHLLEQRPALASVNLTHHETVASADWPYHFTLEAQWQSH